jgi:hypothetical protein
MIAEKEGKIKSVKVLGKTAFITVERFLMGEPQNINISGTVFREP